MAHEQSRRKTQRVQVDLQQRPTELNVSRRFFQAGGFDKNVRAARALEKAFGIGTEFATQELHRRNEAGAKLALGESATGGTRDEDNRNKGYNDAWDTLDAEYDFNLVQTELPELLRQMDAENKDEEQVQAFINEYFKENFGGIDKLGESAYAQYLAPKLLELETGLIVEHRNAKIEQVREEQRTKIATNARAQYAADGVLDYETLFDRTGTFFEGADKKVVFWETIYDLAIATGNPDLIRNVPEQFRGIMSGISDPKLADQHRTAIAQAQAKRDALDAATARAAKEEQRLRSEATNRSIASNIYNGVDPITYIQEGLANGTLQREDASSLMGMWRSQRDDGAKHSFNPNVTAQLRSDLATNPAGVPVSRINDALAGHAFGPAWSPEAHAMHRQMLQDREDAIAAQTRLAESPVARSYLRQFEQGFPVPKDQFGVIKAPPEEIELRAQYVGSLTRALLGSNDPAATYKEHVDAYREDLKLVKTTLAARTPEKNAAALKEGHFTPAQFVAQSSERGWELSHYRELRERNELDADTYKQIGELLYNNR